MSQLYSGRQWRWGVADAALFKTAVLDSADFIEIPAEGGIQIVPDIKHNVADRYRGQRVDDVMDVFNDANGALPTASIKVPALRNELALWIYLMMQEVVEGDTTPFPKLFTFPTDSPDFASNEGKFITLCGYAPVASKSEKVASMIGEKLTLSLSQESDFGILIASIDLKGLGFIRNANPSGTWTPSPRTFFKFHDLKSFQIDSNDIILESFEITINNVISPVGFSSAGNAENLIITKHNVEMNIVGMWDSVTDGQGVGADYDAGNEVVVDFNWGTDGTAGYLDLILHGIIADYQMLNEEKGKVSFNIKGVSDKENTEEILTVNMDDGVDWTWPGA